MLLPFAFFNPTAYCSSIDIFCCCCQCCNHSYSACVYASRLIVVYPMSFKQFDEGRVEITGSEAASLENINNLIDNNRLPVVVEFNSDTAPRIFRRALRTHLLMFISKAASYFDTKLAEFRQVALKYRGQVW